jgi:hypothetical protein
LQESLQFLRTIDEAVHLVMDNYDTYKTSTAKRWLARNPRFHVQFTLTSAHKWMKTIHGCFVTLLLFLGGGYAVAQQPAFQHMGGLTVDETRNGFYAWNPSSSTKDMFSPGVKIVFFGSASHCDEQIGTRLVSNDTHYTGQDILRDTDLGVRAGIDTDIVTPIPDPKHFNKMGLRICSPTRGSRSITRRSTSWGPRWVRFAAIAGDRSSGTDARLYFLSEVGEVLAEVRTRARRRSR